MNLSEAIRNAIDFSVWAHQHINEIDIPNQSREKIALAAFQQSLDVDDAITLLIENHLPGPAYSLARPLLESYICGVWLLMCANEQQIDAFIEGRMPKIQTMIKAMERNPDTGSAWIKRTVELNM